MDQISVEYRYDFRAYVADARTINRRLVHPQSNGLQWTALVAFVVMTSVAFIAVGKLGSNGPAVAAVAIIYFLVLAATYALFRKWMCRLTAQWLSRRDPLSVGLRLDDDGVVFSTSHSRNWLGWEMVEVVFPTAHGICIATPVSAHFVPNAAFVTDAARAEALAFGRARARSGRPAPLTPV